MSIAGKIILRPMGVYNAATTYDVLDLVTVGNKLYISKKPNLKGVAPGSDANSWMSVIDGSLDLSDLENELTGQISGLEVSLTTKITAVEELASTAKTTADTGVANAAKAQTAANTAKSTADTGVANAAKAQTAAEAAQKTADTGVANAATAQTAAEAAQATANTAKTNAATAQTTANTAKTNAATAQAAADAAKKTADTGVANAATAQSTANTAKTNAATAQSTADTAKTKAETNATNLTTYKTATDAKLVDLQAQIEGSITTHFYAYVPTNTNVPAKDWTTTALKNTHLGDLFYNTATGYCYRWLLQNGNYSWARVADSDITKALADAADAVKRAQTAETKVAELTAKLNSLNFEVNMTTGNLEWGYN